MKLRYILLFLCFLSISFQLTAQDTDYWYNEEQQKEQQAKDFARDLSIDISRGEEMASTTAEKIVDKIEFVGLNSASPRVLSEFPVSEGDVWNEDTKNKVLSFLAQLNRENIISRRYSISEESVKENRIKLHVDISEQLPFFPFVLPFYSTTNGFKAKFKFWNFYSNGYPFPIEAEVETKQYDDDNDKNLQLSVKSNDYLKLTERLHMDFDFKAYTTAVHYLIWDSSRNDYQNNELKSGIEDATLKFRYKIPYIEMTFIPRIGFGYGNELVKDHPGDLAAPNVYRKDITIVDPQLEFIYPFKSIPGASIEARAGLDFRNTYYENPNYQDASADQIKQKTEYSFALSTVTNNNPSETPNVISDPAYFRLNLPIPGINGSFHTAMNVAYQKNIRGDGNLSSKVLIPQEYTESEFNKLLDSVTEQSDKDFLKEWYRVPEDNKDTKRFLDKNISETDATRILSILIKSGNFVRSDVLALNPTINFRFPIYNTGLVGLVGFSFDNKKFWQPDSKGNIVDIEDRITLTQTIGMEYAIPFIDANFDSYLSFYYYKKYNSNIPNQEYFIKDDIYEDSFGISRLEFVFSKRFALEKYYLDQQKVSDYLRSVAGQKIKARVKFTMDPLLQYQYVKQDEYNDPNIPPQDKIYIDHDIPAVRMDNFKFLAEFSHSLYLPTYKESAFKLRSSLFSTYNNIIEDFNDSGMKSLVRGNGYKYLGGWFGLVENIDYWIHLLNFDTPKIGGFKIDQDLNWDMFLVLYTDVGAILSDMRDHPRDGRTFALGSYTININNLSIIPIFTVGAAVRVYTRFMPMMINLEINLTPLNYMIQKSFSSFFYFEFSVSRALGSNSEWFAR